MFRVSSVLKEIKVADTATLELVNGKGYWYFVYDDTTKNKYDTFSIYTCFLNDMPKDRWIEYGKDFVTKMEGTERCASTIFLVDSQTTI